MSKGDFSDQCRIDPEGVKRRIREAKAKAEAAARAKEEAKAAAEKHNEKASGEKSPPFAAGGSETKDDAKGRDYDEVNTANGARQESGAAREYESFEQISGHVDTARLNRTIKGSILKLCRIFFPNGKQIDSQWAIGDVAGAPGDSLKIELGPKKTGSWVDSSPPIIDGRNDRGAFTKLLMLSRNWTFPQAAAEIGGVVGIALIQPWEDFVLELNVFYERNTGHYWIPNPEKGWTKVTESGAARFLQSHGISKTKPKAAIMSPMDRALLSLNQKMHVAYAGPLCGFQAQSMHVHGERVLVTTSANLLQPKSGPFPVIEKLVSGLLGNEQSAYFMSWLKVAMEALRSGERRIGQAVALLGPKDCGKTILINLVIVPLLGGRVAEPYQFMSERTTFNAHMFAAEVLKVDDQTALTDINSRRAFGTSIKRITANDEAECHPKYQQPVVLPVFWRLVIAANDEDENIMILPPIDLSIEDKIMLFRCEKKPMPMPTGTLPERKALAAKIREELPTFARHVLDWTIPSKLQSQRYGVKEYQHPDILETLQRLSPEHRLLEIISASLFTSAAAGAWEGSLSKFERELTADSSPMHHEAKKLFSFNTAARTYLQRLRKRYPDHIGWRHGMHGGVWTIQPEISAAF